MGITEKVWAGIVGIIGIVIIMGFLGLIGLITPENATGIAVPGMGIIVAIVVLTLIFGGKD